VNAVGFDVVPGDLCAHLAAEALGGAVDELDVAIAMTGVALSGGTLRTFFELARQPGLRFEDGRWIEEELGASRRRIEFPELGDGDAFSVPIADVTTAPRTTGARVVRGYFRLPKLLGRAVPLAAPVMRALVRSALARLLKGRVPSIGEGPSEEERRRWKFSVVVEARRGGSTARASITGRDPYAVSAETAVNVAIASAAPEYQRAGALSPVQAFGPALLRGALERAGCKITVS
jgi:short subunit dehydrogenase-like uncharacterized protein